MRHLWMLGIVGLGCNGSLEPVGSGPTDTTAPPFFEDPFAEMPDTSEGLVNTSADLEALMEFGELDGACDRYAETPDDRRLKLLCGKSMFFYEGFDTIGIPDVLLDFGGTRFGDEMGIAYEKLGLVQDPYREEGRALGFGPGAPIGNNVQTQAMTCASCHFGALSDGRYSVGAPNLNYRYGTHMLAFQFFPAAAAPGWNPDEHDPGAVQQVSRVLDALEDTPGLKTQLLLQMIPLASAQDAAGVMTMEQEAQYASWEPGTMDFLIAPLPIDDGVHTVSKISHLWGIPTVEEQEAANMESGLLAWTGGAQSLRRFLEGFVTIGDGAEGEWTDEDLEPLAAYIESLRPPEPPTPTGDVDRGAQVFAEAGCLDCHQGPRGSGIRVFDYEEVGTDDAMADWGDPGPNGEACCDMADPSDPPLTQGVKSPRLVGLWSMPRFLHNGSVTSLEALFCLEDRVGVSESPWSDGGHTFACDRSVEDREALIAYLKSH